MFRLRFVLRNCLERLLQLKALQLLHAGAVCQRRSSALQVCCQSRLGCVGLQDLRMVIPFRFCELASHLLQLLVYLSASGALPVDLTKSTALGLGRTGCSLVDSCTPLVEFCTEMLPALRLLQLQLIHLPGQRLTSRCTRSVRTPFLLKLCSKGLSSGLQFGDSGLCGRYLGLQDGASLQSLLQVCLCTLNRPGF